jgi:type II secretory pathway predicted ATPase ExeA
MYREYWGLRENPFSNAYNSSFFYLAKGMEEAAKRFFAAISENRGIMLLVGPTGVGKTYLAKLIADQLRARNVRVAQMITPRLSSESLALEIGHKLKELRGLNLGDVEPGAAGESTPPQSNGAPAVLIIDEAQTITNTETFEVLRALLNHDHEGRFLLTTLLAGDDSMVERLRAMPSLNQRIGVRHRLEPFCPEESSAYIDFRLSAAGANGEIFCPDAKEDIHTIAEGIPRVINTLCDLAMVIGADERLLRIDTDIIARARRELNSLR